MKLDKILKDLFTSIEIIGNYDSPRKRIGHFEAYIRGVGEFLRVET